MALPTAAPDTCSGGRGHGLDGKVSVFGRLCPSLHLLYQGTPPRGSGVYWTRSRAPAAP